MTDRPDTVSAGAAGQLFALRVYYEDTDLSGAVYYANYLKFIERARSEWVRACGIDQGALRQTEGVVFAVRRLVADYLAPARFDDALQVATVPLVLTAARIVLHQVVRRHGTPLFEAEVTLVCIGPNSRALRIPAAIRTKLARDRE